MWEIGTEPCNYQVGDTVAVTGASFGGSSFDIVQTGNVVCVDEKARKVFVHIAQTSKGRSTPTQFDPEDLALLHRPRHGEIEVTPPILRHQAFLNYSGADLVGSVLADTPHQASVSRRARRKRIGAKKSGMYIIKKGRKALLRYTESGRNEEVYDWQPLDGKLAHVGVTNTGFWETVFVPKKLAEEIAREVGGRAVRLRKK